MKRGIMILTLIAAVALAGYLSAQTPPVTFNATASAKNEAKSVAEPVKFVIERFMTDAERATVLDALKQGGPAAKAALEKMPDLGHIEFRGVKTPIKYVYPRSMGPGAGQIITVATAKPIHYVGGAQQGAKPKTGHEIGIAMLILDTNGTGDGEINPAATVKLDASGALVVDDYGNVKVWLKNIAVAK